MAWSAVGDTRAEYEHVAGIYWPIAAAVFGVIVVVLAVALVRFRARGGDGLGDEIPRGRDRSRAEEVYAVLVGVVVAGLLYVTYQAMDRIPVDQTASGTVAPPANAERIAVTAARWRWRFDYPRRDATEVGGRVRQAELGVPVDTPVHFRLTALDVVHSFWIPERRFKMDAFPGRTTTFTLVFPEEGFWRGGGRCNQFCGLGHQDMDFDVRVMGPVEYAGWLERRS